MCFFAIYLLIMATNNTAAVEWQLEATPNSIKQQLKDLDVICGHKLSAG
jgi:hypothetical protein